MCYRFSPFSHDPHGQAITNFYRFVSSCIWWITISNVIDKYVSESAALIKACPSGTKEWFLYYYGREKTLLDNYFLYQSVIKMKLTVIYRALKAGLSENSLKTLYLARLTFGLTNRYSKYP